MSEMPRPELYRLHRRAAVADFEGTAVPGLRAEYLHREGGGRVAPVGRHEYAETEILRAWGWTTARRRTRPGGSGSPGP